MTFTGTSCDLGIGLSRNSTGLVRGGTLASAYGGFWAERGSWMDVGNVTTTSITGPTFRAAVGSTMFVSAANTGTRNPLVSTIGNGNSAIYE